MSPAPIAIANLLAFIASSLCGWFSERIGRRWAMILPALLAIPLAPIYLFTGNFWVMAVAFALQGIAGSGGMFGQVPSYLNERFPTEVRATATAFCYLRSLAKRATINGAAIASKNLSLSGIVSSPKRTAHSVTVAE